MSEPSDVMTRLRKMADVLLEYQRRTQIAEAALAKAAADQAKVELEDLPELMRELKMKEFTLDDGFEIKVEDDLKCGISEANREEAHAIIREMNYGGMIKAVLIQEYDAGAIETAGKNADALAQLTGVTAWIKETIHPGTLKSFLKEQRAKGKNFDAKLFGIHPFSKAKVTPPKEKKAKKS